MALHLTMVREPVEPETSEIDAPAEADDRSIEVRWHEPLEEAARPVRYLWPALSSLWQAGER